MKFITKFLGYSAGAAVMFTGGFAYKDLSMGKWPNVDSMRTAIESSRPGSTVQTPAQLFQAQYTKIYSNYDDSVDRTRLLYAGMSGMLSSLGDPHTIFMEPTLAKDFSDSSKGVTFFGGIGARLNPDPLGVKVIQVFPNSPAAAGGLKSGDVIIGVNGQSVSGSSSDAIVDKIKGEIGTKVNIKIYRSGEAQKVLTMTRAKIVPPSADGYVLEGTNVGYILVTGFEAPTPEQFYESLRDLNSKHVDGFVIDMRGNPGGLLEEPRSMLSLFLDGKPMITVETKSKTEKIETLHNLKMDIRVPITILVNDQSASAAEIFSGVMRDYNLAELVGDHTYGKASVQNVIPITNGASVKITIGHYRLPKGQDIGRKEDEDGMFLSGGIKPDDEVELALSGTVMGDPKKDAQLAKALEVIKEKNAASGPSASNDPWDLGPRTVPAPTLISG